MTRGGDEAGLAGVRHLRQLFRGALRLERLAQLMRALLHALLQTLFGLQQRMLRQLEFGDVGISRDIAAARHGLAMDAVYPAAAPGSLIGVGGSGAHMRQALLDVNFRIAGPKLAQLRIEADQLRDRPADPHHALRITDEFQVAAIPRHDPHLGIDHADALGHVLHCGLQQLPAEAQLLRGFIEHLGDFIQRQTLALERMRQHHPRGGRAYRSGQHSLEMLQQPAIGRVGGLRQRAARVHGILLQRLARRRAANDPRRDAFQVAHIRGDGMQSGRWALWRNESASRKALLQRDATPRRDHQHDHDVQGQCDQRPRSHAARSRIIRQRVRQQQAERAQRRKRRRQQAARHQIGQEQQERPGHETDQHSPEHAAAAGAAPVQRRENARCELRHRRKRQQADGGQAGRPCGRAVIRECQQCKRYDHRAPDPQHPWAQARAGLESLAPQQRRGDVVGDHRRQSRARHHHHRSGGGQPPEEHQHGQPGDAVAHRQRQNQRVRGGAQRQAVDGAQGHHRNDHH